MTAGTYEKDTFIFVVGCLWERGQGCFPVPAVIYFVLYCLGIGRGITTGLIYASMQHAENSSTAPCAETSQSKQFWTSVMKAREVCLYDDTDQPMSGLSHVL